MTLFVVVVKMDFLLVSLDGIDIKEGNEEVNLIGGSLNVTINTVTESITEEVLMEEMVYRNKKVLGSMHVTYLISFLCLQIITMDIIEHAIETIQDCIMNDAKHWNINIIESSENLFIDWKVSISIY